MMSFMLMIGISSPPLDLQDLRAISYVTNLVSLPSSQDNAVRKTRTFFLMMKMMIS